MSKNERETAEAGPNRDIVTENYKKFRRRESPTECRSELGITVGLIDSIITAGHLLKERDVSSPEAFDAISDLKAQAWLRDVFVNAQTEWRVIYRDKYGKFPQFPDGKLTCERRFKVESEARAWISGEMVGGTGILFSWYGVKKEVALHRRAFDSPKAQWEFVEFANPPHAKLIPAGPESLSWTVSRP